MLNIITANQTRKADAHTIQHEPLASLDLMERASKAFVSAFMDLYPDKSLSVLVCCGTGNNGGDGLAIARLLYEAGYQEIQIWIARFNSKESADFRANYMRIKAYPLPLTEIREERFPAVQQDLVIDALLGSGLNKVLGGQWLALAEHLNQAKKTGIAVDVPTGFPSDGKIADGVPAVFAEQVITFQRPKLNFFFPEAALAMRHFQVVDIGLDESFLSKLPTDFYLVTETDILKQLKTRENFSHKGTYGHALLIAGSPHTMGAGLLCAEACLFAGAGLTTLCSDKETWQALNTRLPEVMAMERNQVYEQELSRYSAIAIGPGLGTGKAEQSLFDYVIRSYTKPLVIDADGLTILSKNKSWFTALPAHTIMTPHMKEFDRLFGQSSTWWERVMKAKKEAVERRLVIILKNRYTFVVLPTGKVWINPTGNPAMASGGMGDTLTGILVALLAQGYEADVAAMIACYLHGRAGDELKKAGMAVVPATALIKKIPYVLGEFETKK